MTLLKTSREIELIGASGKILSAILNDLKKMAKSGVNLMDLEERSRELAKQYGAKPAFLGYKPEGADRPYPASLCLSLNDVVVHGVPRNHILKDGDLLKIDMGVIHNGFISDSAITVAIGKINPKAKKLMTSVQKALEAAIKIAKPGRTVGDIGWVIERQAKKDGFFVLKGLTGHGVGYEVHEDPVILNYGKKGFGEKLVPGMVLAIEPMFSLSSENIIQNKDESYSSADKSLTAHFEHTIAIIEKGNIILTK